VILAPGYYPDTYWPDRYWPDDYWPDYGFVAGTVTQAAYSDFDLLGVWRISAWDRKDSSFSLQLEERKGVLKRKIPVDTWTIAAFPTLDPKYIGKPKAIAYGRVYDVTPVCIDTSALKFRVAGHAVHEITEVRVLDGTNNSWTAVVPTAKDAANAEFTLAGGAWTVNQGITADFIGRIDGSSDIMDNPSDVMADVLFTQAAELSTFKHTASFTASKAIYSRGTNQFGHPATHIALSLYIEKETEVQKIVEEICKASGAYLINDFDGKYRFIAFGPVQRYGLESFDDNDIQSFSGDVNTTEIFSSVRVEYQYRKNLDYPQTREIERSSGQYYQQAPQAVLEVMEQFPVSTSEDAGYVGQRFLRMQGEPHRTFKARVNWRGWKLMPGDFVHFDLTRGGVDDVFEVLEVKRSLINRMWVDLVLGDLHGLGDSPGWYADDTEAFPSSLGAASCLTWSHAWTAAQKAFARQELGYWADANGLAHTDDSDSLNTAVWI
jgi:hypothetical protein